MNSEYNSNTILARTGLGLLTVFLNLETSNFLYLAGSSGIIASMSWIESVSNRIKRHSLAKEVSDHLRTGGTLVVRIKNQPPFTVDPVDIIQQMPDVSLEGKFPENFMEVFRKEVDERVFDVMRQHPGEEATLTFLDEEKRVIRDYEGTLSD